MALNAFTMRIFTSLSVDGILLPSYVNWFTHFRDLSFNVEIAPSGLKHIKFVLSPFT